MIVQLLDQNDNVIAFYRPTRPQRYNIGEVHGELHFVRNAGAGVVVRASPLLRSALRSAAEPGCNRWITDRICTHRCTPRSWTP